MREGAGKALDTGCRFPLEGQEKGSSSPVGGEEDEKGSQAEVGHSGGPSSRRGWRLRAGRGARSRRVASRNPARSCLAFVGLSRTLNVFLINRLSVRKPPRGVYNLAVKWERRISLPPALPENIRWGLEGEQKAAPQPRQETMVLASLLLAITFLQVGVFSWKGEDTLVAPSFSAPLSPV